MEKVWVGPGIWTKGGRILKMAEQYTYEIVQLDPNLPIRCNLYQVQSQLSPSHWHEHLEIIYLLEGQLQIYCDEEEYTLEAGDFFVVNSNKIHGTRSSGEVYSLLLQIPFSYLEVYLPNLAKLEFVQNHFREQNEKCYRRMLQLLEQLVAIYGEKEMGYQLLVMARLNEFLNLLYRDFSYVKQVSDADSRQTARLKEVLQYVADHYKEPISLKDAAGIASLNQEYFCRVFKRAMGVTFLEYVNLVRLTQIHRELRKSEESILCIMENNGFTNYKVFNRMFKEQYGMTPSQMKKGK